MCLIAIHQDNIRDGIISTNITFLKTYQRYDILQPQIEEKLNSAGQRGSRNLKHEPVRKKNKHLSFILEYHETHKIPQVFGASSSVSPYWASENNNKGSPEYEVLSKSYPTNQYNSFLWKCMLSFLVYLANAIFAEKLTTSDTLVLSFIGLSYYLTILNDSRSKNNHSC